MNKLKLAFKVAGSKTATQKALVKLINESASDFSLEKQLTPILEGIYACSGTIEGLELYDTLFGSLKDCKPRLGILKTLYICHHVTNMIGDPFCKVFLSEFYPNVLPPPRTHSTDDLAHGILAPTYYTFLLMYAKYYGDIQSYKNVKPEALLAAIKQGNYVPLVQLLTFKNILKYFTTIKGPLEVALSNLKYSGVTRKITVRLFTDVAQLYNMIVRFLNAIIVEIFDMSQDMALLTDELYSDTIQITKKLSKFVEMLSHDLREQIPAFEYHIFDSEFNRSEERYIFTVKKSQLANQEPGDSDEKEHLVYMQKYQGFKVGKREYRLDSEIWTPAKSSLEKKSIQDLSGQSPSTKSSLVGSLTSPRMLVKKIEYQKSFTTPMTHQKLFMSDNIRGQGQEIQSARTTRHDDGEQNMWNEDYSGQRTDTLPDLRDPELQREESSPSNKSPRKQGSIVDEGLAPPSSSNLDWAMSPRTRKLKFSGLFAKKASTPGKINRQVIPTMQ